MYKVEVIADGSGKFVGNGLMFETIPEAREYAMDLMSRWTLVTEWQVIDSDGLRVSSSET